MRRVHFIFQGIIVIAVLAAILQVSRLPQGAAPVQAQEQSAPVIAASSCIPPTNTPTSTSTSTPTTTATSTATSTATTTPTATATSTATTTATSTATNTRVSSNSGPGPHLALVSYQSTADIVTGNNGSTARQPLGLRSVLGPTVTVQVGGTATYGDTTAVLTATVRCQNGSQPVPTGGQVLFTFFGQTYSGTTDAQGKVSVTVPLPPNTAAGTYPKAVVANYQGDSEDAPSSGVGPLVVARRILKVKPIDLTVALKQPNPTTCVLELADGSEFLPGDDWSAINLTYLRCTNTRNYPSSNASETVGKVYKLSATGASSGNYDLRYVQGTLTVVP